jgi:para-aminobenzoate synthetase component 1
LQSIQFLNLLACGEFKNRSVNLNSFPLDNYYDFSEKAKSYASCFNPCVILDSCQISAPLNKGKYKLLIGIGNGKVIEPSTQKLETLYRQWQADKCWLFGVIGFDVKNELEKLRSSNSTCFNWPELSFFAAQTIIQITWNDELFIEAENPSEVYKDILNSSATIEQAHEVKINSQLQADFDPQNHQFAINRIKEEIINGNVYELNLCSRFLYDNLEIENPAKLHAELLKVTPAPFSAYLCLGDKYVLSASPERYLSLNKGKLISQPIKGTRPRGSDQNSDGLLKADLETNIKDRAENVMIVDLVRNDLARVSVPGSVKVEELFGIYSYSHVHQMVSTVCSELEKGLSWFDALKATFPMGSMTGAPKIAALNWIDEFEFSNREWYSGALGYIDPEGNMDFNVLIRSIFYDDFQKKLAYYAGGAITIDSDAEDEYREMMVKAKGISTLLQKYL